MDLLATYIPTDRRQAMLRGDDLPDRSAGAALFADVSGFTPLAEALVKELGPKRSAEELTRQLNLIYDALIGEVNRYHGSVMVFSGDAITSWFDGDNGLRATACALAMQRTMAQFASVQTPSGSQVSLAMKVALAAGPVRRFRLGAPHIQLMDVLAGSTLDRMAAAEHHAHRGEVVVGSEIVAQLGDQVEVVEWREDHDSPEGQRFAVVGGLRVPVEPAPWSTSNLEGAALTEAQLRPWLLPPVYERERHGQGQFLAEIRPAVALFLRFGGIDYDHDEQAGDKLGVYLQHVQEILYPYESYLLQLTIGDKGCYLYSAFGAPLAHDDDPARAMAAALALRVPPPDMEFIRGVQIGISRGRVWAGAYGGSTRRTYGVLGDSVNLAARLMSKAEPGQILVTQDIVEATAQNYNFNPLGLVQVKGKKDALPVSAVLDQRQPSERKPITLYTHPLVGRDAELAQLEQVVETVLGGSGRIVRIEGGPGVGKSHLAAEFAARAARRGLRVAVGACQSVSQVLYAPWRQILRTLLGDFEGERLETTIRNLQSKIETNPNWLIRFPLLGDLLGLEIEDNQTTAAFDYRVRQEALFALVVDMLRTWAADNPLVLLIEDAHWLDEPSQGLTLALGRVIAQAPILLALVQRPPVREDRPLLPELNRLPYHQLLDLSELSPEGIAVLVADRLQGQPSTLSLSLIQAQAQGNPFFTEELVDALCEAGNLFSQDGEWKLSEAIVTALREANCLIKDAATGKWVLVSNAQLSAVSLGIPDSVHGVVLSRIDRLPETHKLTLKVASVVGRVFEVDLLIRVHPARPDPSSLNGHIEVLEVRDFARLELPPPRAAYMFKHIITQEVAYETLLEVQQRELHHAVGRVLEQLRPDAVGQLAYHFSRSGDRDKTLFYLDKAAHKAQHDYANETALNYYAQALALEERWEWRQGLVEVLHILGRREEEQAALRALEAISAAPAFEVAYLWGQYYEAVGDYAEAQAAIERALKACQGQADKVNEVRCLAQLGLIARRRGDYEGAKTWYNQALTLFQGQATYSDEQAQALTQALNGLGTVHRNQGNFDEARQYYEQALMLSRNSGNRRGEAEALNSLGVTAFYQRSFSEAIKNHEQALEIRRAIGDRAAEGISLYNLALTEGELGDYGQSEAYYKAARAIHQATGNRWEEGNIWNGLGVLYLYLGDWPQAQACLEQGLRVTQEIGDEAGQAYILSNLGVVMRDQGNLAAAEKVLTDGLALAQQQDDKYLMSYFLNYLSVASLRGGQLDRAIEQANAALDLRTQADLRLFTADDLATLAAAHLAASRLEKALAYARQARTLLDECGGQGPETPQLDYFICHQVFTAAQEPENAQATLQSAYKLVMERAEKIKDLTLRQSFLERVPINQEIAQAARQHNVG